MRSDEFPPIKMTEWFIWKNTFTGHWMLSNAPRPLDGRSGHGTRREGYLTWAAAMHEATILAAASRARHEAMMAQRADEQMF